LPSSKILSPENGTHHAKLREYAARLIPHCYLIPAL
jgi:hypothetical protein